MKTIFFNGHFFTLDRNYPTAEAVYVEDGRFVAIGTKEEILLQFGRPDVNRVDLQGGFAYPGLVDNHCHLTAHGMKLTMLDFSNVRSKEEMLYLLREKVARTPIGEWVLGFNWDENLFADRSIPTIQELDEIAPNHPVFLYRTCYHAYLVNRAAFQKAGIHDGTPDPDDGAYGRDLHGRLNGMVYENAFKPIKDAIPKPTRTDLKNYIRLGIKDALSKGLTGVHTDDLREIESIRETIDIYHELVEEGFPFYSHHLIYYPFLQEMKELGLTTGDGDEWVRIGACKIFADGAIGGRTALLSEPYHDDPNNCGIAIHSQEELDELTLRARDLGMSIAVHAIGDKAAEMVISAMERVPLGEKMKKEVRDRLIHAQVMRGDLIKRLQRLNVVIDIQPRFVASDFPWVMERLGPHRLEYAYAWKKLLDAGLHCGAGSDAPIEPIDPRLGLHAAITRMKPDESEHPGYLPEEKLTPIQSLTLFTLGSAYTAGDEKVRGSITVGKQADLSVFDTDLLHCDPKEILQAKTILAVTNGRVGYKS